MYMDFHNLNKAYPKDYYPLPNIDQLVDFTVGYQLILIMDVYQRYHQILLAKKDQEKVSFITTDDTFYYMVILEAYEQSICKVGWA